MQATCEEVYSTRERAVLDLAKLVVILHGRLKRSITLLLLTCFWIDFQSWFVFYYSWKYFLKLLCSSWSPCSCICTCTCRNKFVYTFFYYLNRQFIIKTCFPLLKTLSLQFKRNPYKNHRRSQLLRSLLDHCCLEIICCSGKL